MDKNYPVRFLGAIWACLLGISFGTANLSAQPTPPAKVLAIEVQGLKTMDESEVRKLIKVRVGDPFSSRAIDEDVKALWQSHKFADVEVRKLAFKEGLKLIYVLKENPVLAEVKFIHNKHFSAEKLRQATSLKPQSPLDEALLFRARRTVEKLYKQAGYQFVRVRQTRYQTPKGTGISLTIYEGPRVRIRRVDLSGNESFSNRRISKLIKTKPYRFILRRGRFDPELLEDDLNRIRDFYHDRGFFDVEVDHQLIYSEDKSELVVVVNINENTRYVIDKIILAGAHIFTPTELLGKLSSKKGNFYSRKAYQADQEAILSAYGNRGYILARVTPQITLLREPTGKLDLTYRVQEGNRVFIEEVRIRGNYKTKTEVIRRQLDFYPGEQFDRSRMLASRQRLLNSSLFSIVNIDTEPGSTSQLRNVVVEVEEARTGQFGIGGGYSSAYGAMAQLLFVQRNFDWRDWPEGIGDFFQGTAFAGAGQQLRIDLRPGAEYTQFSISFEEPHLAGTNNSLGLAGWRTESTHWKYDQRRTGGSVSLGRRLGRDLSGHLSLKTADVAIRDIEADAPFDVFQAEGRHTINTIGLDATYDKSDSRKLPAAGYRISGSYEHAGPITCGDIDLHRISLEAARYQTLFETDRGKYILSTRALAGLVKPLGSTEEVPFFERMYAGGIGTVRGFDVHGLGPHDRDEPIGGELRLVGNLEFNYPIYKDVVRGILFYDVGQVAAEAGDLNLSDFRSSLGAEVRLTVPTPFGPIPLRFALGFPLDPKREDEIRHFNFTMGTLF